LGEKQRKETKKSYGQSTGQRGKPEGKKKSELGRDWDPRAVLRTDEVHEKILSGARRNVAEQFLIIGRSRVTEKGKEALGGGEIGGEGVKKNKGTLRSLMESEKTVQILREEKIS